MTKIKDTENIVLLGIFLGVIGAVAALILAYFAQLTKEPIEKMKMQATNNALKEVLPAFDNSPSTDKITVKSADDAKIDVIFFGAMKDGKLVGVAGQSITLKGYSGKVKAMVGIEPDGKIRTVAVLPDKKEKISAVLITEQSETPGLGTVVCDRKRQKTIFSIFKPEGPEAKILPPNPILDQYAGKTAGKDPWKVIKDGGQLKYITGATISSRAVADVIYRITNTYKVNKKEIIAKLSGKAAAAK
ncbi:MAG: RnfABCDGE type electron transport complex subunit G [Lentisphaerae bacterium]|nr:RnfABCDGE type electron transport complex subunit G [Lentisphaerota bacterium]MCP4102848.1 RnfABCDGE type electron transport complex subunit G [Lentisphaerota bacterium]